MSGALGATRTIAKPFRHSELLALVQECLRQAGR
jgi:DNA-binding response OmpR family regulator